MTNIQRKLFSAPSCFRPAPYIFKNIKIIILNFLIMKCGIR